MIPFEASAGSVAGAVLGVLSLCISLVSLRLRLASRSRLRVALRQLELDFHAILQYGGAPAGWFLDPARQAAATAAHKDLPFIGPLRRPMEHALFCHQCCWRMAWPDGGTPTPDARQQQVTLATDGLSATQHAIYILG